MLAGILPPLEIKTSEDGSKVELFMHKTLRPILKFQNRLVLRIIEQAPHFKNLVWFKDDENENRSILTAFIQKNNVLKGQLTGLVLALMQDHEIEFYFKYEKEIKKRVIEMCITRYSSQKLNLI